MIRNLALVLICLFVFMAPQTTFADDQEPLVTQYNSTFKRGYLDIGAMFQYELDWQAHRTMLGHSGFSVANARLKFSGQLDKGFGYLLQVNFVNAQGLVDAAVHYKIKSTTFDLGLFKSSFSREYLLSPTTIDFVNRSRIADVLAAKRQIGVQMRTVFDIVPINLNVGVFNGNGFANNANDNENFMLVARATSIVAHTEKARFELGMNGASSRDSGVRIGQELNPFVFEPLYFTGQRNLWGVDFFFRYQKISLSGEYINGSFDGTFTPSNSDVRTGPRRPSGAYLTIGYFLTPTFQALTRIDTFQAHPDDVRPSWLLFGINYFPTSITGLRANYIINTDEPAWQHHQILLKMQLVL